MRRDFIIVSGLQGFGKTVWTKSYAAPKTRLLLYDPKAEYPNVDYMTKPENWVERVLTGEQKEFRFGTYQSADVEMIGSTAYAVGDCTLILEECKMLFDRGEDVAQWARPLIYMGREPRVNLVLVAQRVTAIPPDIRTQANRIVTFLQTDEVDCRALASRIGCDKDEIRSLAERECLDWEAGRAEPARYTIPIPMA